jgi:hypothetical protein
MKAPTLERLVRQLIKFAEGGSAPVRSSRGGTHSKSGNPPTGNTRPRSR